ncbi:zinc finger CCCH domain-containing protein 30-like [Diospyros lotus]|uniref:zinc finger CCCH domain-containing protein 30-like n=1 Tax=Diospyros lotus TaxID=55363 RepID=UPI0022503877|nr:zinc finger CCCH domain-containing protein 30-like [Diospyros lotus]XP_052174470.1 zinc finger CCCH domain-containing protein 30-like [Diospyros lotus]
MNNLTVETEGTFPSLLELAANNDVEGFKECAQHNLSLIDEVGLWYGRQKGSKQMVLEHRTPLMLSATYGSVDVVRLILSFSDLGIDVNRACGLDKSTALHCAASGGSKHAVDVVKLLLEAGADPDIVDANDRRPVDVIVVPPTFQDLKFTLRELLAANGSVGERNSNSPSPSPSWHSASSPKSSKLVDVVAVSSASEKKEYPVDPSLPDIKNSIYSTDEFRMFSFKVRPCSRAYSHDWTECPFVHPGENARRRDPRKYHYSCVPCPEFRKGACRRGDMCEYAHGVFECWLHPAQYRTRLCKDGTNCNRRVCFFAHTQDELRPLYVSTGSAMPSPFSSGNGAGAGAANAMDFAAAMNLLPVSPSSVSVMSPSPLTSPMSLSANGISNMGWPQPNVPALHLPGSNFQSSRLRSSLNARDIVAGDFDSFPDCDLHQQQLLNELSRLSQPSISCNSLNRSARSKTLTHSNLEDLFSAESSSPRYSNDQALASASACFSPTHKSAVLNQFQQQQSMLLPVNTNFSPKTVDHPFLQASFGVSSSGRMSPRSVEPISPASSRIHMHAQRDNRSQQFRSLSSRDLGSNSPAIVGSPGDSWSQWGSSNGNPDWAINADEFCIGRLRRSSSFEHVNSGEEPDLSWVQSIVKESPQEMRERPASPALGGVAVAAGSSSEHSNLNSLIEPTDQSVLGAWLEQMQLDQLMAQ